MMTRLLPCFTVAVATATATTTRVTMDDEPAFFAAALARDDAAARWRAEASAGCGAGATCICAAGRRNVTSAVEDGFAFSWARELRARALGNRRADPAHGRRRRAGCGDRPLGAAARPLVEAASSRTRASRPVHALCRDPAEFDYARPRARGACPSWSAARASAGVTDTSASLFYVEVMRDLIAKGLPGGFDARDAALYADEPG